MRTVWTGRLVGAFLGYKGGLAGGAGRRNRGRSATRTTHGRELYEPLLDRLLAWNV